jgi:hypothetical protein
VKLPIYITLPRTVAKATPHRPAAAPAVVSAADPRPLTGTRSCLSMRFGVVVAPPVWAVVQRGAGACRSCRLGVVSTALALAAVWSIVRAQTIPLTAMIGFRVDASTLPAGVATTWTDLSVRGEADAGWGRESTHTHAHPPPSPFLHTRMHRAHR